MSATELSPSRALAGRSLLVLGGTGFLGKVFVSLLLERFPEIGRVHLLVRSAREPWRRFAEEILPSQAFEPLRRRHGARLESFLEAKLSVVGGDVAEDQLGLAPDAAERIAAEADLVVNCSGLVVFGAPLDAALKTNVLGVRHAIAFARRLRRPALVHVSTCYVSGTRGGEVWEDEPIVGYYPVRGAPDTAVLVAEDEIRECERSVARAHEEAQDPALQRRFREAARERLKHDGLDPDVDRTLRAAALKERKKWLRARLTELGAERAHRWGWPDVYTYTKSLGEQLVSAADGIAATIVRPSIIESALDYPVAGWNEGFKTTAPLIQAALEGQSHIPLREDVDLDLVPVDVVASGLAAVAASACVEQPAPVYQLSVSDRNPLSLARVLELTEIYRRRRARRRGGLRQAAIGRVAIRSIDPDRFERTLLPALRRATRGAADLLDRLDRRGLALSAWARRAQSALAGLERGLDRAADDLKTFRPYMADNRYVFRADNVRALFARFPQEDRERIAWSPETIDWGHYWLHVHCPGLERWVFSKLDVAPRSPRRRSPYRTLLELFEGVTKAHAGRVAMQIERGGREDTYSYAELRECALRAAAFLHARGVRPGDRVALLSENSPEWGMAYFGILRAGATCLPIARDAPLDEVVNLLRLGEARGLVVSESCAGSRRGLGRALAAAGLQPGVWRVDELLALGPQEDERRAIAELPASVPPDTLASILFTSGTTGSAKGVMLTHRNLASQVGQLLAVYDIDHRDGMLSVLPLHHSFELSAGFLLPLSRGARIRYLSELSGEAIARGLEKGHVTCLIGVPALWDLIRRRCLAKLSERSARLGQAAERVMALSRRLRDESSLNLGPLLFLPVHLALGGRIRYLISGGAALSRETLMAFRGMGFELAEGYGLTEASPVLTVNRPGVAPVPGSVGTPLPGVELRIADADPDGVGEVLARAPGVMAGYYNDAEATRQALRDGWLCTGDLGRLDESGRLHLVGRLKDVIVGPDGRNVYPEALEERYAQPALIKELCIVGLREGVSGPERVACLAVPNGDGQPAAEREALGARIEEHVRQVSAALPSHQRVRVLHVWDGELPRTATRKVKRREVVAILERLVHGRSVPARAEDAQPDADGLRRLVAEIAGQPLSAVPLDLSLDQLGFDSLMYAELAAALQASGVEPPPLESLSAFRDLRELARALPPLRAARAVPQAPNGNRNGAGPRLPPLLGAIGRRSLSAAERLLYDRLLDVDVRGRGRVPAHTRFIAAANHASHLDMGLVRAALGRAAKDLVVLAAADYFFDTPLKRAFFTNFTDLVPFERRGAMAESLQAALKALERGRNVLIFPEGTRSRNGGIQTFQRGLGYLALRAGVGVLPLFLETHHALPPGSLTLRSRSLRASVGAFLSIEALRSSVDGMPQPEAEREVARVVQRAVEELRDGGSAQPRRGSSTRLRTPSTRTS